jgi:two-component system sensor histidine kinase VicK
LVIFASAKTFLLAVEAYALDHYQKALQRGVNVTILVPVEEDDDDDSKQQINGISHNDYDYNDGSTRTSASTTDSKNVIEHINKIKKRLPKANLVMTDKSIKTRITILVVDNLECMIWELKDDTLDDPYQAGGIATYSIIPSIAFSYVSIIHIISKQTELYKQLKESKERLEMLNKQLESHSIIQQEFINIAAHELRTPIQPILGLSEIALARINKNDDDDRKDILLKDMLEVISRNARRLHTLTEDILDVTRIDSKILRLNKELIDINDIINEVINDYRNKIDKTSDKEVELVSMIENHSNKSKGDTMPQNDFELLGDKDRIIQILSNLVSNAVKFSPNKGTITISKEVSINDRSVVINVIDRGKGIEPDIFPRLFLKFSTKSDHGTGLGLYICKSLVEAQGGRIWAQNNKDGPGATFSFSLPITIYSSE